MTHRTPDRTIFHVRSIIPNANNWLFFAPCTSSPSYIMPPPVRERYNSKARGSTSGGKKKGKRPIFTQDKDAEDPNASIYVPKSEEVKEMEKREKMKAEVCINSCFDVEIII